MNEIVLCDTVLIDFVSGFKKKTHLDGKFLFNVLNFEKK